MKPRFREKPRGSHHDHSSALPSLPADRETGLFGWICWGKSLRGRVGWPFFLWVGHVKFDFSELTSRVPSLFFSLEFGTAQTRVAARAQLFAQLTGCLEFGAVFPFSSCPVLGVAHTDWALIISCHQRTPSVYLGVKWEQGYSVTLPAGTPTARSVGPVHGRLWLGEAALYILSPDCFTVMS